MDVKIRYNFLIGPCISIDKLFNDGYNAIFIVTVVWQPNTLNTKGETFGNVSYAINYLKSHNSFKTGKNVSSSRCGNVALDAASTAKRNGSNVVVVYIKCVDNMPCSHDEIIKAKEYGVKFEFYKTPVEISDNGIYFYNVNEVNNGEISEFIVDDNNKYFYRM